jgi:molybdate transport system ATP-binding protein
MLSVRVRKRLGEESPKGTGRTAFILDVGFDAPNGITTLLGASGAGKTTTLRLIAGIGVPDEGAIAVGGRVLFDSAKGVNLPIRHRRVGFVFQDYALFPHLTAEQNIAYGVRSKDGKTKADRAREMLSLLHIEHTRRRFPREMSGGEQQRVALARALASDPAIVLLDEPLSAVDEETRSRLLDEIEAAQRAANVPFLYVTHNRREAERLGAYSITLEHGRIIREDKLK